MAMTRRISTGGCCSSSTTTRALQTFKSKAGGGAEGFNARLPALTPDEQASDQAGQRQTGGHHRKLDARAVQRQHVHQRVERNFRH
jgi:hypothetical protein